MIPKYVSFSSHDKDGFLSQHGNFTSAERTIFQKLCAIWEEKIPYTTALTKISSQSVNSTAALQALISKLKIFGFGLIRTKLESGNAVPSHIVLTDGNSPVFFYELIEELITQALISPSFPLPLSFELRSRKIVIPHDGVRTAKFQELLSEQEDDKIVLKLPLDGQTFMFCTRSSILSVVDSIILKLRYFLKNENLQKKLQQLLKISPLEFQKQMKALNIKHWLNITRTIAQYKQEIFSSMQRSSEQETYYYSCFLHQYLSTQESLSEESRQKEEMRYEHFNEILIQLQNNSALITNKTEFDQIIQKYKQNYGEELQDFYQSFINDFVKPFTAGVFPPVLSIDQGFIHQNNIFRYFYERFLNLQQDIVTYCEKEMQNTLRSPSPTGFFLNRSTLETALKKAVREYNSFVAVMLEKPTFFAEAVIHHSQYGGKTKNTKNTEKLLGQFFHIQNMEMRSYIEIFEINPVKIFHRAFSKISFFTRLWWRITGKMSSLEERFHHSFQKSEMEEGDSESSSSNPIHIVQSNKKGMPSPKPQTKKSHTIHRETPPKPLLEKEQFSSKQLEDVWKNFQKSLGKD